MVIDWVSTLQEQSNFINQIARDVSQALASPNLSIEQASRLSRSIDRGARAFDRVVEELERHGPETELVEAAGAIADTWTHLSVAVANKLRTMQGERQTEFPV